MSVYLLDHAAYKPPEELRIHAETVQKNGANWPQYSLEVKSFVEKVISKSGINPDGTYLPKHINPCHVKQPNVTVDTSMEEAEMVMCGAVSDLLEKTGVRPEDVDILITTCSLFCATPSVASMLVNKFKMRPDIQTYHLGGMGCGMGVVAVNLVRDMLKARPNSIALLVPAEITTHAYYPGKDKHRMVANVIFRMGGAAAAFTNKSALKHKSKYELVTCSRVHTGADTDAYKCMYWGPDEDGTNGVYLGMNVVDCASKAITQALTMVAPKVMTWGQYKDAAVNMVQKRMGYDVEPFKPNWTQCCDHFSLHAGGYAVLKGLQKGLGLPAEKVVPSFAGLREYGNTSCSTTWYSMAYIESWEGVKRGQKVLQLGVGGGMKAGVCVWRALKDIDTGVKHKAWAHLDRPLTESDLPRGVNDGTVRDDRFAKVAETFDKAIAAGDKTAVEESQIGSE